MEQIAHTFGIDWRLLLIQAANFGLLLVALWYLLYRPVVRIIEERRQKIAQGVADANAATQRLSEVERSKSDILTKATRDAEDLVVSSKKRSELKEKQLLAEAEAKGARVLSDAGKRAEEERGRVMKEAQTEIARLAILAAEKVIKEKK